METMKVTDATGREVEVEVGADGENPVSPNNPPASAVVLDRRDPETPDGDESRGMDGDRPVSPNNPPERTQTVSEGGLNGAVPQNIDQPVVEAALAEQYPASYSPEKTDVTVNDEGVRVDAPTTNFGEEDEPGGDGGTLGAEDSAPAKSASKGEWVDYAEKRGMDRDEAEDATKDDLIAKYGN